MDMHKLTASLARFGHILPEIVRDVQPDDARWRPAGGAWSILEVVCHLGDEEEYDFRPRIESTLATPTRAWSPIMD